MAPAHPIAQASRLPGSSDGLATAARRPRVSEKHSEVTKPAGTSALQVCIAAACLLLSLAYPVRAELPIPVAEALTRANIPASGVGLLAYDLDSDRILASHNEERAFNPASVMKLVTTLAALDQFGPAHVFKTRVLLEGPLQESVLKGNLVLQGGGDPALTLERLWLLLRELRGRGVRDIQGDVVLDQRYYALEAQAPTPFDQGPLRPYNAPPAALLVNFNTVRLQLGATPRLDPEEGVPPLDIPLREDAPCNGYKDRLALTEGRLTLTGGYAPACGEAALALNLMPPDATAAAWFRQLWRQLGGGLTGTIRAGEAAVNAQPFLEFDSLPVAELVRDTNKFSNNVSAKMLLLNLGAARFGAPATWDKGVRVVREWLTEKDLDCGQLLLENGSGLSRIERATPRFFSRLLRWATRQPLWFEFAASLPAAGLEGTWKSRLPASSARGQAWLKSGSLKDARNLAGYVRGRDGKRRVLVFFINHEPLEGAGRVQDALVEWAVEGIETAPGYIGKAAN